MRQKLMRKGETVQVRSQEEILATLDPDGSLAGLPFMPEMLRYAGQTATVHARADKTCDTVGMTGTSRQMVNTVHLSGVRCDGSAHGGCQAGCLLFWREEWLRRPGEDGDVRPRTNGRVRHGANGAVRPQPATVTVGTLEAATRAGDASGGYAYRCQATELPRASRHLSGFDPRQYIKDLRSRNVGLLSLLRGLSVTAFNKLQKLSLRLPPWLRLRGGRFYPFYQGTGDGSRTPVEPFAPGDWVEIRGKDEIMPTLSRLNTNRGMWFDYEMLPYCGKRAQVSRRVERIIDESSGKMIKLSDCLVLDGVVCTGRYRRFCQRNITPYWRSAWLRRVDQA